MAYFGSPKSKFHCNKPERATEKVVDDVSDELLEIIDQLRGGSSALESTPIVGSEGIGKTTLARNTYNNRLIVKHFHTRAWVTVSQNYSWREIIVGLVCSMNTLNMENIANSDDDELFENVWNMLRGTRYLIVLDDVWSMEVWEWLKDKIPVEFNGSRVLITSRVLDVACCVGFYSRIHHMRLMNADQSWNMLRKKIFERDHCPPELECIGKMIAGSCRGLPLAIDVVSRILAVDHTEAAWENIAENVEFVIHCGGVLCETVHLNPNKRVKCQNQVFEHL